MFEDARIEDVQEFDLRIHGPDLQLSDNFQLWEFASRDGCPIVLVHPALVCATQLVRCHFGKPIAIHSGYRTESHNRAIGGAKHSQHVKGMAADIAISGVYPDEVADYCDEELGMGGVGRYDTFTHIDVWKSNRRWSG